RLTIIAFLFFTTTAAAQTFMPTPSPSITITQPQIQYRFPDIRPPMPKTVPWTDAEGKVVGTVTFWTNKMFLRDTKGELIAQVIVERDGTNILLDPSGKILDKQLPGKLPQAE